MIAAQTPMLLDELPEYLGTLPTDSLSELAERCALSPFHFHRLFVRLYGKTPLEFLNLKRIHKAQELLRRTDRSVSDICFEIGFQSVGTFSARFKQIVGQTPTQYRVSSRRPVPFCLSRGWTD